MDEATGVAVGLLSEYADRLEHDQANAWTKAERRELEAKVNRVNKTIRLLAGYRDEDEQRAELPATRKQLNYLEALIEDVVEDGMAKFEDMIGKPFAELTRGEASEWVGRLSGRAA